MIGAAADIHVRAMGLSFAGPLGVAAGVDRDGGKIASLDLAGFGHIEIGTVTRETRIALRERPHDLRVGINFGSARQGLNDAVIEDYRAALRHAFGRADYLCANLTSPDGGRDGDSPGVEALLRGLRAEHDRLAECCAHVAPLLVKVAAGRDANPLARAIRAARRLRFDGVVLVGADLRRIAAVKDFIGDLALISVGGVTTAEEVAARVRCGASLVQTCSAFLAGGASALKGACTRPP